MCLVLFAYHCHPQYQLVVAANRDEFYERPARPAVFWPDDSRILAGRDLKEGGTWMGVTKEGRFAVLTNYRDPSRLKPDRKSRGHLVQNYLASQSDPAAFIETLGDSSYDYNGFNLLLGSIQALFYYSNQQEGLRALAAGVHGLSNALLDDPWPKVTKGRDTLRQIMQNEVINPADLFAMMADQEQPADQELPHTGVGLEMERMLGPAFVSSPNYGTRVTTLLLADYQNRMEYYERSFIPSSDRVAGEVHYNFAIES